MNRTKPGTVRIIGGRWRGRRLPVPDLPGLRPSGDRSRETLFNWLAPHLRGSRCADLFAGTGALGLEAASRGAAWVVLVEKASAATRCLEENVAKLVADGEHGTIEVVRGDAIQWLAGCTPASLDLVFVDPPFGAGLVEDVLEGLEHSECLSPGGLVYLETARQDDEAIPGPAWETLKDKTLGHVRMRLLKESEVF
ncbi:MAG: 16S rRNA (guanine(966)-N(2))-methyltransferase RsmD [Xanthomonadales bacterium]|nr:16S rRNA (guanine(966)-N(2))-methyltransferase RsmD [Gammaproteobacteria bacterium]MBT8055661.1 16S rRNA (guanine(966)-N(2))-methyltransferase RsmD [Gammaproteobacteria bacterium]NNL05347.1 16S rRNA (guanine(966)-N(2))-methyltransferase RsmD [Xanthomonadales bacterium]